MVNSIFILLTVFILLAFGVRKILLSTKERKGNWGINLSPWNKWHSHGALKKVSCPNCGKNLNTFRRPATMRELLWGGWTCSACGARIDKWGNKCVEKGTLPFNDKKE